MSRTQSGGLSGRPVAESRKAWTVTAVAIASSPRRTRYAISNVARVGGATRQCTVELVLEHRRGAVPHVALDDRDVVAAGAHLGVGVARTRAGSRRAPPPARAGSCRGARCPSRRSRRTARARSARTGRRRGRAAGRGCGARGKHTQVGVLWPRRLRLRDGRFGRLGSDPSWSFSGVRPRARDRHGRRADRAICAVRACSGPDNACSVRLLLSDQSQTISTETLEWSPRTVRR